MDLYAAKPPSPPGTLFFSGAANRTFLECHLNIVSAQNFCELHYCRVQYQRKSSVIFFKGIKITNNTYMLPNLLRCILYSREY
jgi:hypothetical protein